MGLGDLMKTCTSKVRAEDSELVEPHKAGYSLIAQIRSNQSQIWKDRMYGMYAAFAFLESGVDGKLHTDRS